MGKTGRPPPGISFRIARTDKDFDAAKKLLSQYADSLYIDLCFQDFDHELDTLNIQYRKPEGTLIIAYLKHQAIGCVGLRKHKGSAAEMKRMYVKPQYRGRHIGEKLLELLLSLSGKLGYKKILLDTLPEMTAAQSLYRKYGFREIAEYRFNPVAGSVFMAKDLA